MKPISRSEAKSLGLRKFFTGIPCDQGHISERHVTPNRCTECHKLKSRKRMSMRYTTDPVFRARSLERNRVRWATDPKFRLSQATSKRKYRGMPEPTRACPIGCEACGNQNAGKSLHLDHCHETGVFRGWLCSRCNTGLGLIGDSIAAVMQVLAYLERVK